MFPSATNSQKKSHFIDEVNIQSQASPSLFNWLLHIFYFKIFLPTFYTEYPKMYMRFPSSVRTNCILTPMTFKIVFVYCFINLSEQQFLECNVRIGFQVYCFYTSSQYKFHFLLIFESTFIHSKFSLQYVEIKFQLDATEVFIEDLIACSICFGHHYAHHQELKSIIQWLLPVVFGPVVFKLLVWCGADGYVSSLQGAAHNPQLHTRPTT